VVNQPTTAGCAFLLAGEDEAARKERLDALVAERLDADTLAFNLDRFSARDADPAVLATLLETAPLLGSLRVVVLAEAEGASPAVERVVGTFLERPCPTTCLLVLAAEKLSGEPWSTFRRVGREEVFDLPRGPAAVKSRVKLEVKRAGGEITEEAAAMLAELNPEGTAALAGEVAKVLAHAGERNRVEAADVEAVAVSSAGGNKYTFVDLVGMGRREEALAELRALLEEGESPIYLVTLLSQHFLLLGGIRACEARGVRDPDAIARALDMKSPWLLTRKNFRVRGYEPARVQARRYDREAIDRWLAGLLELDVALKSSRLPAPALMEESILRLMSARTRAA
jgi:DNA polymerase-3 subunit delta